MSNQTDNADPNDTNSWSLYPYTPAKAPPIIFAVLLTLLGLAQFYLSFLRFRWKKFGATMIWATSVWLAGFICRAISVHQVQNVGLYIAQFVLVFIGPPLYAAAEYFILGRLLAYFPYHAPIHPGRVLTTFLMLSAVVESLTASGAANSVETGSSESVRATGLTCLKVALILQCFVEALYFTLVATLQYRCMRAGVFPKRLRPVFYVLYITSAMMLVRCVVRTIGGFETARCSVDDSNDCGYINQHEWVLWVFEISNITLFVILLTVFHPGRYLPRSSKIFLDPTDGETERLGPGFSKADKRPFWLTVVDPFNVIMILTGSGTKMDKFWEVHQPKYGGGGIEIETKESDKGSGSDSANGRV